MFSEKGFAPTIENKNRELSDRERVERIISSVELKNKLPDKKAYLSISDFGVKKFRALENQFDTEKKEDLSIVAIVRCWNKSEIDLIEFLKRVQKFQESIPNLKGVFLSINNDGEDKGFTDSNLQKAIEAVPLDIPVVPIGVSNYTWTSGLNAPTAMLNEICLEKKIDFENVRVMNFSFGVDIPEEELEKIEKNIHENKYILTARRTSDGTNPFLNNETGKDLWKKFKEILRYPNEADLTELAYTMRNTLNIIPLKDIIRLGGFNPLCNGETRAFSTTHPNPFYSHITNSRETKITIRSMEDAEFFMRLILNALNSREFETIKNLRRAMDEPVFYDDKDWNKMHELKKIKKIGNEMTALSLIISGLAAKESIPTGEEGERKTVGLVKNFYVPKTMQDFYLRKE
jgi:hypothetical protein